MSTKQKTFLHLGLIIILGFGVYANSLKGEFILDDDPLVKDNVYIRDLSNLTKIFTRNIGSTMGKRFNFYRPIQVLTYMLDYSVWKSNVAGYHLTNIILHGPFAAMTVNFV